MANRKQSVLRVKGQPPESVDAVTVGTDQSQCRGNIDQTWARTHTRGHTRRHTLAFFLTHRHTVQHSFTLTKTVSALTPTHSEFIRTDTHRITQNPFHDAYQRRRGRRQPLS